VLRRLDDINAVTDDRIRQVERSRAEGADDLYEEMTRRLKAANSSERALEDHLRQALEELRASAEEADLRLAHRIQEVDVLVSVTADTVSNKDILCIIMIIL
jgi:hypothetical protein